MCENSLAKLCLILLLICLQLIQLTIVFFKIQSNIHLDCSLCVNQSEKRFARDGVLSVQSFHYFTTI